MAFFIFRKSMFHLLMLSSCCVVLSKPFHETGPERTIELAVLLKLSTLDCVTDSSNLQKKVLFHLRYRSHMEHIPQLCRIPQKSLTLSGISQPYGAAPVHFSIKASSLLTERTNLFNLNFFFFKCNDNSILMIA